MYVKSYWHFEMEEPVYIYPFINQEVIVIDKVI